MALTEHVVLRDLDVPNIADFQVYLKNEGYEGLRNALQKTPQEVADTVKAAGLRGRGGAGFPAGV
jgi:NADH-quinone oxidoreductase subunit F